jgi:hypothetical protein
VVLRVLAVCVTVAVVVPTLYFTLAPKARSPAPSFSPGPAEAHPIDTLLRANTPARPIDVADKGSSGAAAPSNSIDSIPPAIDTLWHRLAETSKQAVAAAPGGAENATIAPSALGQWWNGLRKSCCSLSHVT